MNLGKSSLRFLKPLVTVFAAGDLSGCHERHDISIEGTEGFLGVITEPVQEPVDCNDFLEDQTEVLEQIT